MWELHDPQYGEWDSLGCRDRECRVGKWEPMSVTQISDQCLGSWGRQTSGKIDRENAKTEGR